MIILKIEMEVKQEKYFGGGLMVILKIGVVLIEDRDLGFL